MRRGEVCLVDFEPVRGAEAQKRRPAIVVSNDGANATAQRLGHGVITVVPIRSNIERVYPFQVLLPSAATGLDRDSKAQTEQVRSSGLAPRLATSRKRRWTTSTLRFVFTCRCKCLAAFAVWPPGI